MRLPLVSAATLAAVLIVGSTASAEPPQTVSDALLAAALHCQGGLLRARTEPVLLLPGTGSDGAYLWPSGFQRELRAARVPSCYLNLPDHTNGDMQTSAEYVVFALRTMASQAHRSVAVYGFSQGGVLARLALTFWPSTRRLVADVVSAAAPQHGSTVSIGCAPTIGCSAAGWQRRVDSQLLALLNRGDESPSPTSWTTLRTLDDTIAQPVRGPNPTSALGGARNLVLQAICPRRRVEHLAMAFDAVAYAVLRDAMTHSGPASARRLARGVCRTLFVGDLTVAQRRRQLSALSARIGANNLLAPRLSAEPPVRLSLST
jgi:hypothetical protein